MIEGNVISTGTETGDTPLRDVLDELDAFVFMKDTGGRYTYVNRAVRELFGVPLGDIIGFTDEKFFDIARAADLRINDLRVLQTGERVDEEEETRIARTGETRWFRAVKRPLRDARGGVVGLCGVSTDITARKQAESGLARAEAALREREALLSKILDTSSVAIFLVDRRGVITHANKCMTEMFACPLERLVGSEYVAHVHPSEREISRQKMLALLASTIPDVDVERYYWRDDGTQFWGRLTGRRFQDADGSERGLVGVIADITENKLARAKIEAAEANYRGLFQQAPLAYQSLDSEGRILDANHAWESLFGYTRDEVVGHRLCEFIDERSRDMLTNAFAAFADAGRIDGAEFEIRRKDGTIRTVAVHGRIRRNDSGDFVHTQCMLTDITENRLAAARRDAAEQRFRDLVDSTSGIVWEADASTFNFTFVSREAERLLGYPVADWQQPGFWVSRLHPEDRDWAPAYCAACTGRLENHDFEYRFIARDGRTVWLRDIVKVVDEDGKPRWLRGVMVDITASKRASQRLTRMIESSMDGFLVATSDTQLRECNAALCTLTGFSRDELLRMRIADLDSGDANAHTQRVIRDGFDRFESLWRRKDGSLFDAEITTAYLSIGNEICAFVRDVTHLKQHHRELNRIAHYDSLTGVPNRTLLADRLTQAIAQTRRSEALLAVCYLDLDDFKPVNDRFGHQRGDQVLVEIAARLQTCLRSSDTVARMGGDEFVVLLLNLSGEEECHAALARILEAIARPMHMEDAQVSLSASIGVALYPRDEADSDTLLRHADQAMYLAKQTGRNRYHLFDPEHDRLARDRTEKLARIEHALVRGEFELFYQPQVNMRLGTVHGAEALIRWRHPEHGILPPADFLGVIENNDLIVDLGDWVISSALAQLAAWRGMGLQLKISINVAARQLLRHDFLPRLISRLAQFPAVPAQWLELEVLETAALEDLEHVSGVIRECASLGIGFALDDFGTGYSSLAYLKSLPAETLKIDQSFVRDMLADAEDRAIVEGVIGLARVFNRTVIAEGVETTQHGTMLLGLGCEFAQGYGIARPMPADELPAWVSRWHPDADWAIAGNAAKCSHH